MARSPTFLAVASPLSIVFRLSKPFYPSFPLLKHIPTVVVDFLTTELIAANIIEVLISHAELLVHTVTLGN